MRNLRGDCPPKPLPADIFAVLPEYLGELRLTQDGSRVWDRWRKKYVAFTPEEWVRQRLALYLTRERGFPEGLLALERGLRLHGAPRRFDLLAFDRKGRPLLLAECKNPRDPLDDSAFRQCAAYNRRIQAPYLLVTNGNEGGWFTADAAVVHRLDMLPFYEHMD
ncbi:MAG: type I restriction enzyme HsdR N-terminal domain-containing protein [Bacteroidia bacterium]|nr:type I restriction enzyme HsdR N-terminal domain-containing protein [Bacteroidia bacterium]MDW8332930.1 type I restriction enzyme HsdR N-terminal domain-containing protein [Bacteroidia bacterium]